MGDLSDNLIKLGLGGLIAHGLVKEAKKGKTPNVCDNCGLVVKQLKGKCQEQHWDLKEGWVCSNCAKICPKCKKVFCPKHINKHKCK